MIPILAFLGALVLSYAGTRLLLRRAPRRAFVDVPNARSSHDSPKPRFGGVAIVAAFMATFAALYALDAGVRPMLPLAVGCAVLFAAGLLDDWRGLGVGAKLAAQVAAAGVAIAAGNLFDHVTLPVAGRVEFGWFAYPLTALLFVASVNFYNFIDGIDGLAAGGAFIAGVFLALIAGFAGQAAIAAVAMTAAGAALGFLQFNFPPSRLFMGDSGSTFFGYCFAWLAVAGNRATPEIPFFAAALLLASLYADAGLTIVNRLLRGEMIFRPHRTHYYQRLLQLGLNHKQVTLLEYLVLMLLGASALLYVRAGAWFGPFASAAWVVAFTAVILKIRSLERGTRLVWERRALFLIAADLAAIVVAYLGAYFLRMNFAFTQTEGMAVLRALPIVVIVRTACFFKFGLYRSMWRYTSSADVVRVIKAVTAGSAVLLAVVVLLYRFVAFPRALFLIEYFLLISLVLGARFSTRLFHEIGREPQGGTARRFGIIGAGDEAERAARGIRAQGRAAVVACFIDDDPRRVGLTLHGLPVEGPSARLEEACRRHRLDALVYAAGRDEATAAAWRDRARDAGVVIERMPGGDSLDGEPETLVMDRVERALERGGPGQSSRAAAALRGRRVLVTHGGDCIGAPLVVALRALGAIPVVHFDTASARASARGVDGVGVCAGSLLSAAPGILDAAAPDIVVHVVGVEPAGGLNDEEYAWDHVVRETEALARAVWRRPGCRLVIAAAWGHARPGDRAAAIGAAMEAVVLGRAGAEPVSVIRIPRVLSASLLRAETAAVSRVRFDLLEGEAARLVMEIAAGAFRGIYAPAPAREIDLATARAAALNSAGAVPAGSGGAGASPVFPAEHLDECGVPGARRVLSPLFPAADPFRRLVLSGPVEVTPAEREQWISAVSAQLQQTSPRAAGDFEAGRMRS